MQWLSCKRILENSLTLKENVQFAFEDKSFFGPCKELGFGSKLQEKQFSCSSWDGPRLDPFNFNISSARRWERVMTPTSRGYLITTAIAALLVLKADKAARAFQLAPLAQMDRTKLKQAIVVHLVGMSRHVCSLYQVSARHASPLPQGPGRRSNSFLLWAIISPPIFLSIPLLFFSSFRSGQFDLPPRLSLVIYNNFTAHALCAWLIRSLRMRSVP